MILNYTSIHEETLSLYCLPCNNLSDVLGSTGLFLLLYKSFIDDSLLCLISPLNCLLPAGLLNPL